LLNEVLAAAPEKAEFQRVFGKPGGGLWQPGDRLEQPDLARSLQLIADLGPEAFYRGEIADKIVVEMERGKGLITASDLTNYSAVERSPLSTRYHGYDVYAPPPPSSGGICLIEELNMLDSFNLKRWGTLVADHIAHHVRNDAARELRPRRAISVIPPMCKCQPTDDT